MITKLSEFIKQVGDENVRFQNLKQSMTGITTNKAGISKITFETDAWNATQILSDSEPDVALVVFIPKSKLPVIKKDGE